MTTAYSPFCPIFGCMSIIGKNKKNLKFDHFGVPQRDDFRSKKLLSETFELVFLPENVYMEQKKKKNYIAL